MQNHPFGNVGITHLLFLSFSLSQTLEAPAINFSTKPCLSLALTWSVGLVPWSPGQAATRTLNDPDSSFSVFILSHGNERHAPSLDPHPRIAYRARLSTLLHFSSCSSSWSRPESAVLNTREGAQEYNIHCIETGSLYHGGRRRPSGCNLKKERTQASK